MITLRDAQLSDATTIAQLHAQSWQLTYRGIYSDTFLNHEVEQDRYNVWKARLAAPGSNQQVIVAVNEPNLVGFACLYLDDDPEFGTLLDNLHIAQSWQQSGIGKRLLKESASRICRYCNNQRMYLWVYASNINARKVYERLGAVHVETVEQPTASGTTALACRYAWTNVTLLL